jgi:hypothetical protein
MLLAFFLLEAKNDIEIFLLDIEIVIDFFYLVQKIMVLKLFYLVQENAVHIFGFPH